jgi:hypothetical protein
MTGPNLVPCAHCHQRHASVRLYRITGVGPRPLCEACFKSLDALGMAIRAA